MVKSQKIAKVKKDYFSDMCIDMIKQTESDLQKGIYHIHYLTIDSSKANVSDMSKLNMLLRNGYNWVSFK